MRVKQGRREGRGEKQREGPGEGRGRGAEGSGQGGEGAMGRGQRTGRGKGGDEDGLARHASRQAMHGCPPPFSSAHAPLPASFSPTHSRLVSPVSESCLCWTDLTDASQEGVCLRVGEDVLDRRQDPEEAEDHAGVADRARQVADPLRQRAPVAVLARQQLVHDLERVQRGPEDLVRARHRAHKVGGARQEPRRRARRRRHVGAGRRNPRRIALQAGAFDAADPHASNERVGAVLAHAGRRVRPRSQGGCRRGTEGADRVRRAYLHAGCSDRRRSSPNRFLAPSRVQPRPRPSPLPHPFVLCVAPFLPDSLQLSDRPTPRT